MASTSTSNSHSTSTLALASPPSTTILSTTTTTTTSCSSSASHCTPEGNDSSPIVLSMAAETPLEHCSPSSTSERRHNEMETGETLVEVGKSSNRQDESTSPRPLTDSPKDKADNSSIKTRKKRKKNNSSCRIIRAGEDVDDSCTFSSSSSASDNEKQLSTGKKRFFRKRENHRKNSSGHLSPFDFEDDVSSEQETNSQRNRKLDPTRTSSERRFSRRKSSFFNKFPDLIWGSSNNNGKSERNKEKMGHSNLANANLVEDDDIVESHAELIRPMKKDSLKKQVELKQDRRQFIDEQLKGESNETTLSPSEMFSTHYNLRWKNHQNHMLLAFESLLYNESFVDVSLVCSCDDDDYEEEDAKRIKDLNKLDHDEANDDEGKVTEQVNANRNNEEGDGGGGGGSQRTTHKNETVVTIKAHKIVLSASSEFFQRIFAENPCKHPVVILTSFQRWEVQALVDFMYRGEVDVSSERLSSIIKTAASLQIRGLADYAGKFDTINKHEESIEPHSPLPHQHNLNMSSAPKLPPQIIMNRKTMEGLRRGLDRELLREHRSNSSMDVDNEGEEDHLEMMRIRRQQRSLSPKLLNLSMGSGGSNSGHTHSHLSSKPESVSSTSRNKSNFQREEPQATLGQSRDPEPFPHTNHHHRQKQLRQPDHQEILNNNNGNSSSNDFIHHYGTGNLAGTNHHLNTSPMFIPRRKQARPRRRSGDFVAVAQDLRKGNVQPEALLNHDQSPPPPPLQNPTSRSSSRTPTSTPSSTTQQTPSKTSNQNHNQVQQNMNSHQHLNPDHLTNHIRQQNQALNHSQQQFPHHRRSRHHRRSNHSQHHVRPLAIPIPNPHDDLEEHETDEMDENQVLDYTTSTGATFNNNSLIAAGLNHPHPLAMKHWISSTPPPPLNQRNSPTKGDGDSDDGLTPPPEQCHTPPISPTDPKGFPVDFPLFGLADHHHLHNNRNLPLTAFKTSPPSPSSFFLSGFNANGPLSMSISLAHSDESNNAGEPASTPPNVFSPAGFPMPMALPLTNSNSNNTNSNNHGGAPGLNSQGQRSSPVGWPGLPLGPAPIFGRHRAQHSAPRGGPPRAWSNADLTEALHNVWNKKMTTSQASRIFGIPYNSLLMYVRGKYGKSLKLDLLKKGLDMALENKANSNNSSSTSSVKEGNNASAGNHNHATISINNNNNNTGSGKGGRLSNNSNNNSPSSQNINNNNISKSKSHHNQHHHHHHPAHHHHSQHSHHHHHQSAGGSPPLGIGNIGLVGLGEPPDIPAGFNPFTAAASIFGDYPAPFPFASALSHILPPGSLITADKVALNDDDK